MRQLAAILVIVGVVDQVDNGVALVEWETRASTFLEVSPLLGQIKEGSTITLTVKPPLQAPSTVLIPSTHQEQAPSTPPGLSIEVGATNSKFHPNSVNN